MGEMVSFASNGGTCEGYLAVPESGSGPGVIVIQEWWGLVDHVRDVADRFAAEGFVALAPDFFHGATTTEPDEAAASADGSGDGPGGQGHPAAPRSTSTAGDESTGHGVGAVGFCMGGSLALWSGALADEVKVAVGFYPRHPLGEDGADRGATTPTSRR